ncbi:MAG: Crp/Fnr family transcriptional regulator [Pseudomonadota bacterium]
MYHATHPSVSHQAVRSTQAEASAPVVSLTGAQQNDLLRALSREELISLFEHLELVPLEAGKHLFDFGDKMEYAYFPTNAIVSLQFVTEDGGASEIGVVGRDGVVGVSIYESERANCSAVVQSAGYGYRIRASVLRTAFFDGGALAQQLMRHTSALFAQLAQTVAGARHGSIEQRLCRWLLERLDRSLSNELKVTQEAIANLLGVRRESITCCAGKLQEKGMIECRRGTVVVLDRDAMERHAGGCYIPV